MQLQSVSFGVVDWDAPALVEEYYPSDLPADWRLDYFANEYPVVVVPAEKWQHASAKQWAQWHEDADGALFFLIEAPKNTDEAQCLAIKQALGECFLGYIHAIPDTVECGFYPIDIASATRDFLTFVVQFSVGNDEHLKCLRDQIQQSLPVGASTPPIVLIIKSDRQPIEAISTVRILLELMGYSV